MRPAHVDGLTGYRYYVREQLARARRISLLRHHGVPARSRIGFAGYFTQGWHHDHVVPEAWLGGRWVRCDPS